MSKDCLVHLDVPLSVLLQALEPLLVAETLVLHTSSSMPWMPGIMPLRPQK